MQRPKQTGHRSCSVFGCNSETRHMNVTFFTLPADDERRAQWLRLIDREELKVKPHNNYSVCEIHFQQRDIMQNTNRKQLRKNAVPYYHLPIISVTREEPVSKDHNPVQVPPATTDISQVNNDPTRKRKIEFELPSCETQNKIMKEDGSKSLFHKLCDRFLTKELSETVKLQTNIKQEQSDDVNQEVVVEVHSIKEEPLDVLENNSKKEAPPFPEIQIKDSLAHLASEMASETKNNTKLYKAEIATMVAKKAENAIRLQRAMDTVDQEITNFREVLLQTDDCDDFGNLLAKKLKKLTQDRKDRLMKKISQIVF